MKILGLETANMAGGAALMDETSLIAETRLRLEARHAERLLAVIDALLKESGNRLSDLDGIAVSIGPGSFTGLRIGLATAKGLVMGAEKPLVLVPTMEAVAAAFPFSRMWIAPCLDARRGEVFWSLFDYREGILLRRCPDQVGSPEKAVTGIRAFLDRSGKASGQGVLFVGEGGMKYRKLITGMMGKLAFFPPACSFFPSASHVAERGLLLLQKGKVTPSGQAVPLYLRPSQAELKRKAGQSKMKAK